MKKVLVYPFSEQQIHLVRYISALNPNYEIGSLCAYSGSGLVGKDAAYVRNGLPLGITVSGDPLSELDKNDTVVLCSEIPENQRNIANDFLRVAREKGKEIFCFVSSDERSFLNSIDAKCTQYISDNESLLSHFKSLFHKICAIDTPVVLIGALDNNLDQLEVLTGLFEAFIKKGYRTSAFGNSDTLELIGMHSYNFIMSEKEYAKKIVHLNNFVKAIEETEHPDIILIQVPGTMLRYNDTLMGDVGVNAYMFTEAFKADYFICCSMFDTFSDLFFKPLSKELNRKFGLSIDAVHLSNKLINMPKSMEKTKSVFYRVKRDTIERELANMASKTTFPVYDLLSSKDIQTVCNSIEEKLGGGKNET